jgi:uncharacterized membrane protein YhaH (DUF805 family)
LVDSLNIKVFDFFDDEYSEFHSIALIGILRVIGFSDDLFRMIVDVIFFLPFLSVAVRRLHDIGESGKWMIGYYFIFYLFLGFGGVLDRLLLPFIAFCLVILSLFSLMAFIFAWSRDGEKQTNRFGESPKYHNLAKVFD